MACGLLVLLLAVVAVLGGLGVLVWLGGRKVIRHLRQDPEGARLLVEHIVMPLLGKEAKPEAKKVKGFMV